MKLVPPSGKAFMEFMEKKWGLCFERGRDGSYAHRMPYGVKFETEQAKLSPLGVGGDAPWETTVSFATVLYDEEEKLYKIWYGVSPGKEGTEGLTSLNGRLPDGVMLTGYATSEDGWHWNKPDLGAWKWKDKGTNLLPGGSLSSTGLCIDPNPGTTKYKAFKDNCDPPANAHDNRTAKERSYLTYQVSDDGIKWRTEGKVHIPGFFDSQNILAYDRVLGKYVGYLRGHENGRSILRVEGDQAGHFSEPQTVLKPDNADPLDADFYCNGFTVYPYDPTIRLMFPTVYTHHNDLLNIRMAVSRDGRNFEWITRDYVTNGLDENCEELKTLYAMHDMVPLGDRVGVPIMTQNHYHERTFHEWFYELPAPGSRYLWATWERDRLAGLVADMQGEFCTPPIRLDGDRLLINGITHGLGHIRVEILFADPNPENTNDTPGPGVSLEEGDEMRGNIRWAEYTWNGNADLSSLRGETVVIRFLLLSAKIFGYAIADSNKD